MAAEPGLLLVSGFCFLLLLPPRTGVLGSGLAYLEPPFNVKVHSFPDRYSVVWDWNDGNREDAKNVTFSVFVYKLKKKRFSKLSGSVPGCLHISHQNCSIDPSLIDTDKDYKVQVQAEISQNSSLSSDPVIFSPTIAGERAPPIAVRVEHIDGGISIEITRPKTQADWYDAVLYYILLLRTNSSTEERKSLSPKFHLYDLTPGENYCFKVNVFDLAKETNGKFSPEKCFKVEALGMDGRPYPENITIDALNTNYTLKWDWDHSLYPNVTFSVEMVEEVPFPDRWQQVDGCENIRMLHCNFSSLYIFGIYTFRVAASFDNQNRTLSRSLRFHPHSDTTIGPPSNVSAELLGTMLQIKMLEPKAFHDDGLKNLCDWEYNLIYWKDNMSDREEKSVKEKLGRFAIEVESSTTYCMKAHVVCQDKRGLFSKKQCITTGAGIRPVWNVGIIIGLLVSIVLSALVVYLCACPLKRYIRHIFYPAGKLPSSIENGMLDSRVKIPFVLQEEEATDMCYIIRNSELDEDHVQNPKYYLKESSTDSGNYSNEDEATGGGYGRWPLQTDNVASSTTIHLDS